MSLPYVNKTHEKSQSLHSITNEAFFIQFNVRRSFKFVKIAFLLFSIKEGTKDTFLTFAFLMVFYTEFIAPGWYGQEIKCLSVLIPSLISLLTLLFSV